MSDYDVKLILFFFVVLPIVLIVGLSMNGCGSKIEARNNPSVNNPPTEKELIEPELLEMRVKRVTNHLTRYDTPDSICYIYKNRTISCVRR